MESMHYVGLDIHKKIIAFCIKTASGRIIKRGTISATRQAVNKWLENLPQPWMAAMEATLFTATVIRVKCFLDSMSHFLQPCC